MRILIAHEAIDTIGGVESYLDRLLPDLVNRGHDVAIVYHTRRSAGGVPTWGGSAGLSVGIEESGLSTAVRTIREWRPDVCFSHNMRPLGVERALLQEWPVVKMMHGYFGTCASGLKMHAFPASHACTRTFGPACLAMYVPRRCGQLRPRQLVGGYRWASEQQSLLSLYASVTVASAHMGTEYERHGVPRSRINVLPLFPTIESRGQLMSGGAVLFAGRMTALKGGHVLVAAVAAASRRLGRPLPLVMAGDGPQRSEWEALAARFGLPVEFTGWIQEERRDAVFRSAALIAIPSLWPEPFGIVGLEAAAMGVPAVAFDVGGIREWLRPGRNGLLVPPEGGVEGLAAAIVAIFSDDARRARLSDGARGVAAELSRCRHVERLETILASSLRVAIA